MRTQIRNSIILAVLLVAAAPAGAQTRLVNMIPQSRSGETNQDAEPTLTVDLNDYSRIVGSAFTWDNLTGSPMVTATAPIFVSLDRGATWTPRCCTTTAGGCAALRPAISTSDSAAS